MVFYRRYLCPALVQPRLEDREVVLQQKFCGDSTSALSEFSIPSFTWRNGSSHAALRYVKLEAWIFIMMSSTG